MGQTCGDKEDVQRRMCFKRPADIFQEVPWRYTQVCFTVRARTSDTLPLFSYDTNDIFYRLNVPLNVI